MAIVKLLEIRLRGFLASGFYAVAIFFAFLEGVFTAIGNRITGLPIINL
jgi:hypothetical protein